MIANCQTTDGPFIDCETIVICKINHLRETIVYFAVKMMKCPYIYESGLGV